ncbi:unnamed protein product [Sphenostylis stenocarpa]|uniref:NADH dehydrogenase [ubiquinone] 1 alpha subcomplex subunit 12 n=1 Tax=Sphenostylis stenocarpa TaxID=92480 RepID=A0AA86SPI6_9FABA|nr:unnamed protein product [Sphenostylis stenocarpa]
MQRLLGKISGLLSNRTKVGVDKAGNKYFTRNEEVDGVKPLIGFRETLNKVETELVLEMKEKRWVIFKGEEDPTSIPVEWICWLNGQRKKAPTPEEMMELEARRERVRQNVALLKKEEQERIAKEGSKGKRVSPGKASGPDLKSFIQQFPVPSEGNDVEESTSNMGGLRNPQESLAEKTKDESESSEPTGSGASFRPEFLCSQVAWGNVRLGMITSSTPYRQVEQMRLTEFITDKPLKFSGSAGPDTVEKSMRETGHKEKDCDQRKTVTIASRAASSRSKWSDAKPWAIDKVFVLS